MDQNKSNLIVASTAHLLADEILDLSSRLQEQEQQHAQEIENIYAHFEKLLKEAEGNVLRLETGNP